MEQFFFIRNNPLPPPLPRTARMTPPPRHGRAGPPDAPRSPTPWKGACRSDGEFVPAQRGGCALRILGAGLGMRPGYLACP
ncbi:unnamed protein product [Boreogadus saida]